MICIENIHKFFPQGAHALKGVSFKLKKGEFLVIIGLSGSGKSTLLRCINRIIPISEGRILFEGRDVSHLKGKELRDYRSKIGMIFQHFNLIERQSVLKNALTGSLKQTGVLNSILGLWPEEEVKLAKEYLAVVGLEERTYYKVNKLSGGQKQRVAIARALMQRPQVLLADEPVASLDPATSHSVMKYLKKINETLNISIICNLHFLSLVRQYAHRVIALKNGEIVYEGDPLSIDKEWFKKIYGAHAAEVEIS